MYGYFRCNECDATWESAHTHPKIKGNFVHMSDFYTQDCKTCDTAHHPYRVEPTKCKQCGKIARYCHCNKHSDPSKPHRSDLCEKCRSGRPCQRNF